MASNTNKSYHGSAVLTASDTVLSQIPCRAVLISCTVAGLVKVGLPDGSTLTFEVAVGTQILELQAMQFFVTGTTATATMYQLV